MSRRLLHPEDRPSRSAVAVLETQREAREVMDARGSALEQQTFQDGYPGPEEEMVDRVLFCGVRFDRQRIDPDEPDPATDQLLGPGDGQRDVVRKESFAALPARGVRGPEEDPSGLGREGGKILGTDMRSPPRHVDQQAASVEDVQVKAVDRGPLREKVEWGVEMGTGVRAQGQSR